MNKNKTTKSVVEITCGVPFSSTFEILARVRKGLPFTALDRLQKCYGSSRNDFLSMLVISLSTARRRAVDGKLSVYEGDKILRYARLLDLTFELMDGNKENAIQWLSTPNRVLRRETPLSYAETEVGAEIVRDLIAKIEHGIVI